MSYWVELHCDLNIEAVCRGEQNNYPMGHVSSLRSRTMRGLLDLEASARRIGWTRLRDGRWACPECHKAAPKPTPV